MRTRGKEIVTTVLAVTGTVLVWLPILAPVILGLVLFATRGIFRIDYLMPAELLPLVLGGGAALVVSAVLARMRPRIWLLVWTLTVGVVALVGSQLLAVVTGLASGRTAFAGWPRVAVLSLLGIYVLSVVALGVVGVLLIRDLRRGRTRTRHGDAPGA